MRVSMIVAGLLCAGIAACGGGGGAASQPPAWHDVTLSWTANREKGVNQPGGGYHVSITGSSNVTIELPFESGVSAAPTVTTSLYTGSYTATVTAYAALDPSGGSTGSTSQPATLTIVVP